MEKTVLKIKLTIAEYQRARHIGIFTGRRHISSFLLTKQNHLGKCSNRNLRT